MSLQNGYTILRHNRLKILINELKSRKSNAYYRKGSFSTEVIWQGRKFLFPAPQKKILKDVWVFRSVIAEAKQYIETRRLREKTKLPTNYWNPNVKNFRGKVTATDVDHAYWRIAFLEGIIKPKTYRKGLKIEDKSLRLAALGNLASIKEYQIIEKGVITENVVQLKYDPILQKVYNNIRYTCFEHMMNMAKILGDEFICYKTDCIYYKDKPENRELVQIYLDTVDMEWKQLVEPERPKNNEHFKNENDIYAE